MGKFANHEPCIECGVNAQEECDNCCEPVCEDCLEEHQEHCN